MRNFKYGAWKKVSMSKVKHCSHLVYKAGKDDGVKQESVEIKWVHYTFAFISNKLKLYGVYWLLYFTIAIVEIYHKCSSDYDSKTIV